MSERTVTRKGGEGGVVRKQRLRVKGWEGEGEERERKRWEGEGETGQGGFYNEGMEQTNT